MMNELIEAAELGIDATAYTEMTPREREVIKKRAIKRLKSQARRFGIDPDRYVAMTEAEREAAREDALERVTRTGSNEEAPAQNEPAEPEVYTAQDPVPPREVDPAKRDRPTIGVIEERAPPPALRGATGGEAKTSAINTEAQLTELNAEAAEALRRERPATLTDLYARWPIGEPDGHYFLRVERTQPKVFQSIAVAGYVGDIRSPISEKQFQQYYGGREYDVTLYGPDPSGRHDAQSGLPKIVKLTSAIRITVPLLPPNLAVLPAAIPETNEEAAMMNPFAPLTQAPSTPADAQIHKTNTDFMASTIKMVNEDAKQKLQESAAATKQTVEILQKQTDQIIESERRVGEARERTLREHNTELKQRLDKLERELETATGKRGSEAIEFLRHEREREANTVKATTSVYQTQLQQTNDAHRDAMQRLKDSHDEALKTLRQQHEAEVKRLDERLREQETYYSRRDADERRKADDREKQLKDEIERVRREERETAERRLSEQRERFEDRIKDLENAHKRELGSVRENIETRKEVSEAQLKMQIAQHAERIEELKEQLEAARSEAEENKDPVAVIAKAKEQAEKLGYKEDKDEKSGWDLFASMAGGGVGQFLQSANEWLPAVVASMRKPSAVAPGIAAAQLQAAGGGAGGPPGQTHTPAPFRARRTVAWASEDEPARPVAPPKIPQSDLGFQSPGSPSPAPDHAPPAAAAAPAPSAPPAAAPPAAVPPAEAPPAEAPPPTIPNRLAGVFADNEVFSFLHNIEMGIDAMEAADFARLFVERYPAHSRKLVERFGPDDVIAFLKEIPEAIGSPILRRDGSDWLNKMFETVKKEHAKAAA